MRSVFGSQYITACPSEFSGLVWNIHPPLTSAKWYIEEGSSPISNIHCVECVQYTLYEDGTYLIVIAVLVHNCHTNIPVTPPQSHRGLSLTITKVLNISSNNSSNNSTVATSVARSIAIDSTTVRLRSIDDPKIRELISWLWPNQFA